MLGLDEWIWKRWKCEIIKTDQKRAKRNGTETKGDLGIGNFTIRRTGEADLAKSRFSDYEKRSSNIIGDPPCIHLMNYCPKIPFILLWTIMHVALAFRVWTLDTLHFQKESHTLREEKRDLRIPVFALLDMYKKKLNFVDMISTMCCIYQE